MPRINSPAELEGFRKEIVIQGESQETLHRGVHRDRMHRSRRNRCRGCP